MKILIEVELHKDCNARTAASIAEDIEDDIEDLGFDDIISTTSRILDDSAYQRYLKSLEN